MRNFTRRDALKLASSGAILALPFVSQAKSSSGSFSGLESSLDQFLVNTSSLVAFEGTATERLTITQQLIAFESQFNILRLANTPPNASASDWANAGFDISWYGDPTTWDQQIAELDLLVPFEPLPDPVIDPSQVYASVSPAGGSGLGLIIAILEILLSRLLGVDKEFISAIISVFVNVLSGDIDDLIKAIRRGDNLKSIVSRLWDLLKKAFTDPRIRQGIISRLGRHRGRRLLLSIGKRLGALASGIIGLAIVIGTIIAIVKDLIESWKSIKDRFVNEASVRPGLSASVTGVLNESGLQPS